MSDQESTDTPGQTDSGEGHTATGESPEKLGGSTPGGTSGGSTPGGEESGDQAG